MLDDPPTSNMLNVPWHCWNLHYSTFIRFIDHYQVNWVWKWFSYWHDKSWDCLLTHWLPMKSMLFLIETISRYQFRCNYLKKKNFFSIFSAFLKCSLNFQYIEKKRWPHRFWISEITDSKNMVREMSQKSRLRGPFHKQQGKRVQALLKSA